MLKKTIGAFCLVGLAIAMFPSATLSMPQCIRPNIKSPIIAFTCSEPISPFGYRLGGICTVRADGSDFRRLTEIQTKEKPFIDKQPVWSPDGRNIAFLSNRARNDGDFDIYIMNPDGSRIRRITNVPGSIGNHKEIMPPLWSTDSMRLAYIERTANGPSNFWVINADGSGQRKLDVGIVVNGVFEWLSPDAIAFISERGGKWELFSVNQNGSNIRSVMSYGRWITSAVWSPDRKRIAFSSGDSGIILYDNLYVGDARGPHVIQLTNEGRQKTDGSRVGAQRFAWSPDGKQIAFTVTVALAMNSPDTVNMYVINADGSALRLITTRAEQYSHPGWSPDGKYIAFHSYHHEEPGRPGIYIVNSDGSNERFLVEGDDQTWRPCATC